MNVHSLQEFVEFLYSDGFSNIDDVSFDQWPLVDIKIYGDKYNGTITPDLAKSIYDFYMDMQRAYAYIKYGSANLQRLTNEDKDLFGTVEFRVEEGSLKLLADISEQMTTIASSLKEVVGDMDSKHKAAVLIVLVLAVGGYYTIDSHFDHQTQVALADQNRQQKAIEIEGQVKTISEIASVSKAAITALSEKDQGRVFGAAERFDSGYNKIIKSVPDADKIDISGAALSNEDIAEYISSQSDAKASRTLTRVLKVEVVSKKAFPKISVRFSDLEGEQFTLSFEFGYILEEEYSRIFDSIKSDKYISVEFKGIYNKEGVLTRGTILSVKDANITKQHAAHIQIDVDDEADES